MASRCACPGDVHRISGSAVSGAGWVQAFVGARLDSQPGFEHGGVRGFSCEGCLSSDRGFSRFYGGWVGLLRSRGRSPADAGVGAGRCQRSGCGVACFSGCSAGRRFPAGVLADSRLGCFSRLRLVFRVLNFFSNFWGARPPPRPPAHSLRGFFWKFKGFVFGGGAGGLFDGGQTADGRG